LIDRRSIIYNKNTKNSISFTYKRTRFERWWLCNWCISWYGWL